MPSRWSPHPRYRLYTNGASYISPLLGGSHSIERFETEVSRRFNVAAAVCVPMARTGLFFVLREVIRPGQKVIMSPLTIVDVVNAVLLAGGVPIFADIDRRSCAIDIDKVNSLIDRSTAALLLTHLHGETAGAHRFREICQQRGLRLIEDSAQAFGAIERGKRLGTIGDAGIYSFGFYKNLTTWRGGMVVSNDAALIERIRRHVRKSPELPKWRLLVRMLRGLAVDAATHPSVFATITQPLVRQNFGVINRQLDPESDVMRFSEMPEDHLRRMRESQARIGIRQLDRVDRDALCRIEHANRYHEGLAGWDGIITPQRCNDLSNIYTYFPIQISDRDSLLQYAQQHGRDFAAQHLRNYADLPMFAEFRLDCPNAGAAARELVLLPTYPRYPTSEVKKNIEVIREFFRRRSDRRPKETTGLA
jgi:perosamine synthetase